MSVLCENWVTIVFRSYAEFDECVKEVLRWVRTASALAFRTSTFVCVRVFIWLCSASITIPRLFIGATFVSRVMPEHNGPHIANTIADTCIQQWITIVHLKFIAQNVRVHSGTISIFQFFIARIALFVLFILFCFPFDWRHTKSSYRFQLSCSSALSLRLVGTTFSRFYVLFSTTAVKAITLFSSLDICNLCYENIRISMALLPCPCPCRLNNAFNLEFDCFPQRRLYSDLISPEDKEMCIHTYIYRYIYIHCWRLWPRKNCDRA